MLLPTPKTVHTNAGDVTAVAEFDGGKSFIAADDGCWVLFDDGQFTAWWPAEAVRDLKQLPDSPHDYKPLRRSG